MHSKTRHWQTALEAIDASGRSSVRKQLRKAASGSRAGQRVAQLAHQGGRETSEIVVTAGVQALRPGQMVRLLGAI
jgi:hypothetical protein